MVIIYPIVTNIVIKQDTSLTAESNILKKAPESGAFFYNLPITEL